MGRKITVYACLSLYDLVACTPSASSALMDNIQTSSSSIVGRHMVCMTPQCLAALVEHRVMVRPRGMKGQAS